jgi:hypothetical protein
MYWEEDMTGDDEILFISTICESDPYEYMTVTDKSITELVVEYTVKVKLYERE